MFIGITQRLVEHDKYKETRECLALDWGELFAKGEDFADFVPLPLSYEVDFLRYARHLQGVIFSGGNDLSIFTKESANKDYTLSLKRDAYESKIIKYCIDYGLPLLGICRGAQMIAHYFGAKFITSERHIAPHEVFCVQSKSLDKAQDKNKYDACIANSFHRYCIKEIFEPLIPLAIAKDDTIEAYKHAQEPIFGIMWHIERDMGLNNKTILSQWLQAIKDRK